MSQRFTLLTVAILAAAGCASTGTPHNEKAESSSAAIRAAEEVGATHNPEAALHLQLAKEQYEYAQRLPDDKPHADRLLRRAQVDAELALALARSDDDKAEAQAAVDKVKTLKPVTQ